MTNERAGQKATRPDIVQRADQIGRPAAIHEARFRNFLVSTGLQELEVQEFLSLRRTYLRLHHDIQSRSDGVESWFYMFGGSDIGMITDTANKLVLVDKTPLLSSNISSTIINALESSGRPMTIAQLRETTDRATITRITSEAQNFVIAQGKSSEEGIEPPTIGIRDRLHIGFENRGGKGGVGESLPEVLGWLIFIGVNIDTVAIALDQNNSAFRLTFKFNGQDKEIIFLTRSIDDQFVSQELPLLKQQLTDPIGIIRKASDTNEEIFSRMLDILTPEISIVDNEGTKVQGQKTVYKYTPLATTGNEYIPVRWGYGGRKDRGVNIQIGERIKSRL